MITVCTNTDSMQPIPIPDEFRGRFEELLEPDVRAD